jgi:PKD repeat protein
MSVTAITLRILFAAVLLLGLGAHSPTEGASFHVAARDPDGGTTPNLVGNPSFETDTSGWKPYPGSTTLIEPVAGGVEGAFALEIRGPASTAAFGINDSPNWVAASPAIGTRYRLTAWVRSAASTGQARLRVREYVSGTLVGVATYSPFVPLTPAWQLVAVDYVTQRAGSNLDVQLLDYPLTTGEVFQTDGIRIEIDSSSGAIDDPFKSINYALTRLRPGDTLYLRGGTYHERVAVSVSGTAGSPIVVQSYPGEMAVIDSGPPEFRTAGNNDWELVDAVLGEYRSARTYPSGTVYGHILGIPGYENECVALIPYASAAAFRATTDVYTDSATPFYAGPGVYREADNSIHIRLQKTAAMRFAEQRYGTVFTTESPDPREYAIVLSVASSTLNVSGSYVTFKDLTLNQAKSTIALAANASHLRFDGITAWHGNRAISVTGSGVHDVTVTRSRIYGDLPYWIFWSDTKDPPAPADLMRGTAIHLADGTHDWEISYNHIRGGDDGISTNTAEYNIFIHHNRIENFKDDALELEGTENVGKIAVFENYIGNSLVAIGPGQDTPRFDGPLLVYRNVMVLLRPPPVNRKEGINTWNEGLRYGFEHMFGQASPNTHYYHNTLVMLNSAGGGLNLIPQFPADTYVANNLAVMVNGVVNGGGYRTGPGQIVDGDLYWKMNTVDTAPLLATYDTVAAFRLATGLELNGLGDTPKRGTDPLFATFRLEVVDPSQSTWALLPGSEVFKPSDFLLGGGSPAIGAGVALPVHPTLGRLPDSRTSLDIGALPASALAAEYDIFPFLAGPPTVGDPPNGVIDIPLSDVTIPVGESVTFSGTGSDPDGNLPLTYLWDFGGGADSSTAEDPGVVVFNTPGIFTVTFTVTDSTGASDPTPDSRVITVTGSNQAPEGVIDTPLADVTITVGGSVSFTGTGTDPEGNLPLRFLWNFGGGAANQTVEDPGDVIFNTRGTYTVTFTVTDSLGAADPTPASRVITVNAPPNGVITKPTADTTIVVGQTVTFAGSASDPDDHLPLSFLWDFGGGAPSSAVEDPGAVTFSTPGIYAVTFTVTDSLGLADPTPASRMITVNAPPDGTIDSPAGPVTIVAGETVTFAGSGSDPEDHLPLTFLWNFGGGAPNQTVEDPGAVTFSTRGVYTVTFTVTDSLGAADPTPASRVITVNAPPDGTIDSPATNVIIVAGQSVSFAGTGTDPDNHLPLTFLWTFGGGASNAAVEDPGAVVFSTPGTYTATFTVTDSLGAADATPPSRLITVADPSQAPNGVIDTPLTNVTITVGDSVSFTGTGTGPEENMPLSFLWNFAEGAANQTVEDPGAVVFNTPGTFTVSFTVTDSLGLADPTPDKRVITVVASNAVANPSFETDTSGWKSYPGSTTLIERVPGGQDGAFALEVRGPATTGEFGINDSPNWVTSTPAAGTRYRVSAWVRAAASTGQARIRVREYLNGSKVGGTTYSPLVPLTPAWQLVTLDYIAQTGGAALDVQVLDYPVAAGEVFQTDNIIIRIVP